MTEPGVKPVLVVGSGKGGVGKSVISILIAHALSERGIRVLLVDGSQNLGHLHVMLGISVTARLEHVFRGDIEAASLIQPITERLSLLASDSGETRENWCAATFVSASTKKYSPHITDSSTPRFFLV